MSKSSASGCVGAIVAVGILVPLSAFLHALLLVWNWAWFVVPLGVHQIGLAHAYGLSILIACFIPTKASESSEDDDVWGAFVKAVVTIVLRFVVLGGMGWLVHQWMI